MVISDKQELRRCIKQNVRRAKVTETLLDFDVFDGTCGMEPMLEALWQSPDGLSSSQAVLTPFSETAQAVYASMDALGLPVRDFERASSMQQSYDRNAWLREVLDAMNAQRVLLVTPLESAEQAVFEDDRFAPLLSVCADEFSAGRYGVNYESTAQRICAAVHVCGAKDICLQTYDEQALRYCILPVCEDTHCVLHIRLNSVNEVAAFTQLLDTFPGVRTVVSAPQCESTLIHAATNRMRMLVRLDSIRNLREALECLGTRVIPYSSCATSPEMMLGKWIGFREKLWQALLDAYLPVARSGFVLESTAIEKDIARLLGGNLESLYL